jgi:hypothetical protein
MMEPHMIENYIFIVFVIVVNHVGFIIYQFNPWVAPTVIQIKPLRGKSSNQKINEHLILFIINNLETYFSRYRNIRNIFNGSIKYTT